MKKELALLSLILCSLFAPPLMWSFASSGKIVENEVDETLHFQRAHAVGLSTYYYVMNTSEATGTTSMSDLSPKIVSYLLSGNFTFVNLTVSLSHEPIDSTDYRLYVSVGLIDSGFEHALVLYPAQSDYLNLSQTRTELSLSGRNHSLYTMSRLLIRAEVTNSSGMHKEILWGDPSHDSWVTYTGTAEYIAEGKPVHNLDTRLDYTTIMEAVDDSQTLAGDTIFVERGTYFEPLTLNKQISLVGENVDGTIIYGVDGLAYAPVVVDINVAGVTVEGFTIRETYLSNVGVNLDSVENCSIIGNKLSNLNTGVSLNYSSNNRIIGDNFTYMWIAGIDFYLSMRNDIVGNVINQTGFYVMLLENSSNNTIHGNYLSGTDYGVGLYSDSNNNSVYNNNFLGSSGYPIYTEQVQGNVFNADYPTGGNYFEGYDGPDSNYDGIGDSPEPIYQIGQDDLPLMGLFSSFNTSRGYTVEVVSNSTIEDFAYFESNNTIMMHVSNMTANQTMGFCRIAVPHALMNETYHITVDGAEPYFVNYTLYDNGTDRWIYFAYQLSRHEIIMIPEFPPFLSTLVFTTLTLLAIAMHGARRRNSP